MNHSIRKSVCGALLITLVATSSVPVVLAQQAKSVQQTAASGWVENENEWRVYPAGYNGPLVGWSRQVTGQQNELLFAGAEYYFDQNGLMQKGWQKISDKWYYLGEDGKLQTGWLQYGGSEYYLDPYNAGAMVESASVYRDGKEYCAGEDGRILKDEFLINPYDSKRTAYYGSDGVKQTGWISNGGDLYYSEKQNRLGGLVTEQWKFIDYKWYYFDYYGKCLGSDENSGDLGWLKQLKKDDITAIEGVVIRDDGEENYCLVDPKNYDTLLGVLNQAKGISIDPDEQFVSELESSLNWYYITTKDGVIHSIGNSWGFLNLDGQWYYTDLEWGRSWFEIPVDQVKPEQFFGKFGK